MRRFFHRWRGTALRMVETDVAPGVHRVEDAHTNWYLVEHAGRLTVVDAGVPTSWRSLQEAVRRIGRSLDDIAAVVLTHAHFDHIGSAERIRSTLHVPVHVHVDDVPLTRHPTQYARERSPLYYVATKPKALPVVAGFVATRAFFPKPIEAVETFGDEGMVDVPGSPRIVPTPGHTIGHVSFHLPDRDVLIAGDAVVTFNPYTGSHGPQIVARSANADSPRALGSLDAIAATGASVVLTGHGPAWRDGAEAIVEQARRAGIS